MKPALERHVPVAPGVSEKNRVHVKTCIASYDLLTHCIRHKMHMDPDMDQLRTIIESHFAEEMFPEGYIRLL